MGWFFLRMRCLVHHESGSGQPPEPSSGHSAEEGLEGADERAARPYLCRWSFGLTTSPTSKTVINIVFGSATDEVWQIAIDFEPLEPRQLPDGLLNLLNRAHGEKLSPATRQPQLSLGSPIPSDGPLPRSDR